MTDERRRAHRYAIWFPMQLSAEGESIIGISRDVSELGVMLVTAARPEPGETVTVSMALPHDPAGAREVTGRIVRVDDNPDDPEGLWRHRVAVEFTERVAELEPLLEDVSRTSHPPPPPRSSFPPPRSSQPPES